MRYERARVIASSSLVVDAPTTMPSFSLALQGFQAALDAKKLSVSLSRYRAHEGS